MDNITRVNSIDLDNVIFFKLAVARLNDKRQAAARVKLERQAKNKRILAKYGLGK